MKSIKNLFAPFALMLASASVFALQIPTGDNVKVSDIKQDGDAIVSVTLAEDSEITLPTGDKKMCSSGSVLEFYKSGVLKEFELTFDELKEPRNIFGIEISPVRRYAWYEYGKPILSEEEQKLLDNEQKIREDFDKQIQKDFFNSRLRDEKEDFERKVRDYKNKIEQVTEELKNASFILKISMSESGSPKNFSSIIHSNNYVNSQDSYILIKMGGNQIAVDNVDFYDAEKGETPKISKIHLYDLNKTYTFQVNGVNYEVSDEYSSPHLNDKAIVYFWPNGSLQLCYAKSVSAPIETSLGKITARTERDKYDQEKLLDHQDDYGYYERGELGDSNFNVSFYEDGAIQSLFTDEFLMTNLDGMKLNIPAGSFLVFWPDGKIRFCKSSAANTLKIKNATFDIPENEYYAFDKNEKFIGTDFGLKRYCSDVPDENTWGWADKDHPKSGRTYTINFSTKRDGENYKFALLPSDELKVKDSKIIPEIERGKKFMLASLDFDKMEVSTYEKDADGNIVLDDLWFPKESAKKYKLLRKKVNYRGYVGYEYYVSE